ncbi:hypothetical protein EIP86_004421 [Pleurotus ostreatoroseus]|nr:hypothetical protein EIP86_004421 [Pleurotus ostreatoroseus]
MATNIPNDIASTEYSRRRKALFELIKALRDLGADAEIGRPRIAVIGGQSGQ